MDDSQVTFERAGWVIGQLLQGCPESSLPLEVVDNGWAGALAAIQGAAGADRHAAFEHWCADQSDGGQAYQAAVFKWNPGDPDPASTHKLSTKAVPNLPAFSRLTPAQEQEAATTGEWLDQYVAFASEASPMTPTAFHIAAGVFVGALVIARRLYLRVSVTENDIFPNLYMLYVGPSTIQRKSTALRVIRGLLRTAGLESFLLADRQTPEALALDMTTRIPSTFDGWPAELRERWLQERAIAGQRGWLLEEASHLLDSFNRDFTAGLLPMILDLYDCPSEAMSHNTIARGREMIERPYLCTFGVTTYGAMAEHMSKKQLWANGFFARFALVGSDHVGTWCFWPPPKEYPDNLVTKLRHVATQLLPLPQAEIQATVQEGDDGHSTKDVILSESLAAHPVEIDRGGSAWCAWENYAKATSFEMLSGNKIDHNLTASYGRLGTMLIKVAIILAAFDATALPVKIEARHVYRAQQIVEDWRANLHGVFRNVEDAGSDDTQEKIKAILAKAGSEWVSRRDLLRALTARWSDIKATIDDLEVAEQIERRPSGNKSGRKSEDYRLVTDQ